MPLYNVEVSFNSGRSWRPLDGRLFRKRSEAVAHRFEQGRYVRSPALFRIRRYRSRDEYRRHLDRIDEEVNRRTRDMVMRRE